jgi:hypothetical protein
MTQLPAVPPPVGQISNFAHPKDVLHTVNLATQVLCIVVVTIFVVIRIWIKAQYHQNLNAEDCAQYLSLRWNVL